MYAIVEVGSKQYKVSVSDEIDVERLDKKEGETITLDRVLLFSDNTNVLVGKPYLKDVKVEAEVLKHYKARKVISYKYRRRKSSHWKKGHRQLLTRIRIKEIQLVGSR
jgi:large subunit ribosomal protein L21